MAETRITSLRFDEVIVPARPSVINSKGLDRPLHMLPVAGKKGWSTQFDQLPKLVLRLELSNGIVGLGEFYRDHDWNTIDAVAQNLLGMNIDAMALQDLPISLCREYDGFECAIWDAVAKNYGVPLVKLLGGAVQNKIKVGAWSSHRKLDEVGDWIAQYRQQGYDTIKFKADLEDDVVALCEQAAKKAPGMAIIFDPNQRWENLAVAKPIIKALEAIGNVLLLEDPLPKWMMQDYADLRFFTSIPIVQHVSLPYVYQGQRAHDSANLIAHRAVDGFNFNAGIAKFQQLTAVASAANMFCWHGSEIDLGILEAMYLHQAAAAACCVWPSDIFGRLIREHDLLTQPLLIEPPYATLPRGPGLGVTLDPEALAAYATCSREYS